MPEHLERANATLLEFEELIARQKTVPWEGPLRVGVDLGTANIVLAVVDQNGRPVAGESYPSSVVRDGIVFDYVGAVTVVRRLKETLEGRLGVPLVYAAAAIPPGVTAGSVRAIGNVVEAAGLTLTGIVDEPTAAARVLEIQSGAVVDVGGGTTGISIIKDGRVIISADEPTGGTHMTLVLAGFYGISLEEAEARKKDPAREADVFAAVRPVVEKMAAIAARSLRGQSADTVYVVGGASCFSQFTGVFEAYLGLPVIRPAAPLLVTPLGIALNCAP